MIGALYFAHDAWRFPVFYVPKFSFPEGANIIFSDSIPLFALFGKIIYKVSGQWMNYFGLYIVICFPLLAAFVAVAAKQAGTRDPLLILGAALLALASLVTSG